MNIARELCIIFGISFLGECLGKLLPFPVPASIYGMLILLFALMSGLLQVKQVEKTAVVILISILAGTISSFISVFAICQLLGSSHEFFVSMLPKSITTAIGMGVCEELGGIVTITVAVIIVTGIVGSILSNIVFKIFQISDPVAQGLALGTAAHAIGTSKALAMGEVQGAMSSLSIAVAGILTVVLAPLVQNWII